MPVRHTIVEIHVPLQESSGGPEGSYPFPFIDRIEDFLADLEETGDAGGALAVVPDEGVEEIGVGRRVELNTRR